MQVSGMLTVRYVVQLHKLCLCDAPTQSITRLGMLHHVAVLIISC